MNKFIKSQTILSLAILIYYIVLVSYAIINWSTLSDGEGWGIVAVVGLAALGIPLIISEVIIRIVTKNNRKRIISGAAVMLVFLVYILIMELYY